MDWNGWLKKDFKKGRYVPLCFVCKETSNFDIFFMSTLIFYAPPPRVVSDRIRIRVVFPRMEKRRIISIDGNWQTRFATRNANFFPDFLFLSRRRGIECITRPWIRSTFACMNMRRGGEREGSYNHSRDRWIVILDLPGKAPLIKGVAREGR